MSVTLEAGGEYAIEIVSMTSCCVAASGTIMELASSERVLRVIVS